MCDIATNDDTRNESEFSSIFWNSMNTEIDSFRSPSEISIPEGVSITDEHCDDDDNDDNCDNRGQDLSQCINSNNPESVASLMSDKKENDEVIDETLLPLKLRQKKWIVGNFLGNGSFFRVYQAYSDGILLAIRRRYFRNQNNTTATKADHEIESEYQAYRKHVIDVLLKIGYHDNIATFFGSRRVGVIWEMFIEFAAGGDLFHEIDCYRTHMGRVPEEIITSRFRDLTRAVAYLHERKIAHLDIKVENCLITKWGSLKLSDFDYAIIFNSDTTVSPTQIGTRAYAPPQRFSSSTKPECADVWSCGIVLLLLITFRIPWVAAHKKDPTYVKWFNYINEKKTNKGSNCIFPLEFPDNTNSKFSDLLEHLLDPSEDTRMKITDVVNIYWLKNECCKPFVVGEKHYE
ncbi:unnamed protein product [Cercopithifilaria johnstoni]|uniref:non-specific serine/threonine protein kinase n=1 Tax=Cercopithifilaria johnstoni TaxID=2874296 RepID=A0A8J2LZ41_9BILA|nr:unnamed protein product [Cercopithifilaria johnstoni]